MSGKNRTPLSLSALASAPLDDGSSIKPSWQLILDFEYQLRVKAYELVRDDGLSIKVGLERAIKDPETRELHLVGPFAQQVAIHASRRSRPPPPPWSGTSGVVNQFGAKGKDKGTKGEGKAGKKGDKAVVTNRGQRLHTQSGGQNICFAFNSAERTCPGDCGMLHVCQRCLGSHPRTDPSCTARTGKGGKGEKGGKAAK